MKTVVDTRKFRVFAQLREKKACLFARKKKIVLWSISSACVCVCVCGQVCCHRWVCAPEGTQQSPISLRHFLKNQLQLLLLSSLLHPFIFSSTSFSFTPFTHFIFSPRNKTWNDARPFRWWQAMERRRRLYTHVYELRPNRLNNSCFLFPLKQLNENI